MSGPQQWKKSRRVEETFASDTNNNVRMTQTNLIVHKAFDSHFHLDRANILSTGSHQLSIEECLEKPLHPPPEISVDITRGVLVYCDPDDTFPTVLPDTSKWKTTVGLHPKAAPYFTQGQFDLIRDKLSDKRVAGLGEIGLDRTCNPVTWVAQEKVCERSLGLANPNRPVIIHVRGERKDKWSENVYRRALDIVKANGEREQKIHLHSFHGGVKQVQEWRGNLPNTYFSFNMMCKDFNGEQKQSLISVPGHRLLLETPSPYLSLSSDIPIKNPRYLGNVALIVGGLRGMPVAGVLAVSVENGSSLFS